MPFANGVAAAVGRTPLIKLKRASEETGCTILGKAEFMNPGQSVKDRAALYSYYTTGVLKSEGSSITEGIGQGRITKNLEGAPIDVAYQIPDEEAVPIIFDLLEHEGLCLGGSTGINIAGAVRLAKELGPGHTIVTILADYGTRYQSKLFNPAFLREKKLPVPAWLERRSSIKAPFA